MNKKERIVNFKQFKNYLFEKGILVIVLVFLFAAGLAAYGYKKQEKPSGASIGLIVSQNQTAFAEGSPRYTYKRQPDGTVNASLLIKVDFKYMDLDENKADSVQAMSNLLQGDVTSILKSQAVLDKVIDKLDLRNRYEDTKNITAADLKWMINKYFNGERVLTITVTDVNEERAVELVKELAAQLSENAKSYASVTDVTVIDDVMIEKKGQVVKQAVSKKKLAILGLAGAFIGFLFSVVVLFVIYIVKDVVRTEEDLSVADADCIGKINKKDKENGYKFTAANLVKDEKIKKILLLSNDDKELTDIACELQKALAHYDRSAKLYSSRKLDEKSVKCFGSFKELVSGLDKSDADLKVILSADYFSDPDAILLSKDVDMVVLCADYGKTNIDEVAKNAAKTLEISKKRLNAVIVK